MGQSFKEISLKLKCCKASISNILKEYAKNKTVIPHKKGASRGSLIFVMTELCKRISKESIQNYNGYKRRQRQIRHLPKHN